MLSALNTRSLTCTMITMAHPSLPRDSSMSAGDCGEGGTRGRANEAGQGRLCVADRTAGVKDDRRGRGLLHVSG
eukprot:3017332-Rhodomonas_salina.2